MENLNLRRIKEISFENFDALDSYFSNIDLCMKN